MYDDRQETERCAREDLDLVLSRWQESQWGTQGGTPPRETTLRCATFNHWCCTSICQVKPRYCLTLFSVPYPWLSDNMESLQTEQWYPAPGGGWGSGTDPCSHYLPVLGTPVWIYFHLTVTIYPHCQDQPYHDCHDFGREQPFKHIYCHDSWLTQYYTLRCPGLMWLM